jgi:hypothetical protein
MLRWKRAPLARRYSTDEALVAPNAEVGGDAFARTHLRCRASPATLTSSLSSPQVKRARHLTKVGCLLVSILKRAGGGGGGLREVLANAKPVIQTMP